MIDPVASSPYTRPVQVGSATLGGGHPFVLIAGPALARGGLRRGDVFSMANTLCAQTRELDVPWIFRIVAPSPEDRAATAFEDMLVVARDVHSRLRVPVAVEVHHPNDVAPAAEVADLLQIPAACCRDVELVTNAARTGRPVNIETDPSLAPADAVGLLEQVAGVGNWNVMLTARGINGESSGIDVRGLRDMREAGFPLVYDVGPDVARTDSKERAAGELAQHALTAGVDGIALIVEDDGEDADPAVGTAGYSLAALPRLLQRLKAVHRP